MRVSCPALCTVDEQTLFPSTKYNVEDSPVSDRAHHLEGIVNSPADVVCAEQIP